MPRIKGGAFRFSTLDVVQAFAARQARPVRVVLVLDKLRPYGHYLVVSVEDAETLERRGHRVVV